MTEREPTKLDIYLAFITPTCVPAQTFHDHEEFARFYLGCLTDPEYLKWRGTASSSFSYNTRMLWSDEELILKARQHAEAARILKGLDELHDTEEDDNV